MKITAKILSILPDQILAIKENFLDVTVGFYHDTEEEPRETRKYGFSTKSKKSEILVEVKKALSEYANSLKNAEAQAEVDAELDNVAMLQDELAGEEVTQ
jgi:hypothetical protein